MRVPPGPLVLTLPILLLFGAPASAVQRRAFVTSVQGTGDLFSWPGSSGATALERGDSICRARATAGGLPNAATYRAWLSTSTVDAYCHVQGLTGTRADACHGASQPGGGPWYQWNGVTQFTADLATLTGPGHVIYRPVLFDEFGTVVGLAEGGVWTGTGPNGTVESTAHCLGWMSASSGADGLVGHGLGGSFSWTSIPGTVCSDLRRLLCLEPGASEASPVEWQPGSLTFVTSIAGPGELESWPQAGGEAGLAAGDAICQNLAGAAHLPAPQSFVAWLSDATADAVDALTGNGPFRRLDGFAIAGSKAALVGGPVLNSIHIDENFVYIQRLGSTWTGTGADGLHTGTDCAFWSSSHPAVDGTAGLATFSRDAAWSAAYGYSCESPGSLYCFSNVVTLFWDGFDYTGDTGRWSSAVP